MGTTGTVRSWNDEQGWGIIDSGQTPGGCWAHFTHVAVSGYRSLAPQQQVTLEWERASQDGFNYRAVRVWPAGTGPFTAPAAGPSDAYKSTLGIHVET